MKKRFTTNLLYWIILMFIFSGYVQAQQTTINGRVTDAVTGEGIAGVNIVEKGTNNGTITDLNGHYTIEVSSGATLMYSFIGYNTEEVAMDGQAEVNISMVEDIAALDEVVVIGYGTQRKGDITSSVASVKEKDFLQGSVRDVGQLLQGKVAGLSIANVSGDPTANTQIRLRGNTTLSDFGTSGSPLVMIDGIPGDLNTVAPEDIESIDVLKDGSAAAIYGTQGTNGVILITTRRASGQYTNRVQYSVYASTQTLTKEVEMSTAADFRQQIADGYRIEQDDKGATTDWMDEITRTPFSHVHNLTFQGGNDQTNYLANINYDDAQGIFLKSNNQTANIRADVNHSMFDNMLKINLGALTRHIQYSTTGDGASFNGYTYRQAKIYNPTAPLQNEDGTWYEEPGAFNYDNPVARLKESDGLNSSQFNRFSGSATFQPINGLKLKSLFSYSKYNQSRGYAETKNHISTIRAGLNGFASRAAVESIESTVDLTAEYSKSIGANRFTILGGYSYWDRDRSEYWMNNIDFPTDRFGYNNIELGRGLKDGDPIPNIHSEQVLTNLIAFFGRATYNYDDRYLFMGSVRYEAASQLYGTDNPWGTFPAASVGWRISNEQFMDGLTFVSDLKLRAGYGVTGTQPIDPFLGLPTLAYSGTFYSDGEWRQTLEPDRNRNKYLRWEEKKETNIGLDYGFLEGRINGSIDYYIRTIDGLLYQYPVPTPPNLVSQTLANVGEMENKGLEVLVNLVPVRTSDFEWTTSLNYSQNSNQIKSLSNEEYELEAGYFNTGATGEPIQTYTHRVETGEEIGNFYGFKVVDVTEDGRWIYEDKAGNQVQSEDFARVDSNKMVLGNGLPDFYAGWNNTFRYKNFDLSITMRGAFDFQLLNFERMYLENTLTTQYNRLQSAFDPVFGKAVLSQEENLEFNSYYIEDGDYWKIDNITLGYNFQFPENEYISTARVYVSTLNTFTFTNYKGVDPEVQVDGLEPGNDYRDRYPTTRTYTIGFNVTF